MTFIFSVVLILLTYSWFKYSAIYKRHLLISEIAQKRRDLIKLLHEEKINVNSEVFKMIYYNLEYLLRIKYFNLNHMLPSLNELKMQYQLSLKDKNYLEKIDKELEHLSKDKEIAFFLKDFGAVFFKAIFQKKFIWQIIGWLAKAGVAKLSKRIMKLVQTRENMTSFHNLVKSYAN